MPPINQQGSRAGLITALVIFVVLFVASTIFAIYYHAQWSQANQFRTEQLKSYKEVTDDPTGAPAIESLRAARDKMNLRGEKLLNVATLQTGNLANVITGQRDVDPALAVDRAKKVVADVAKELAALETPAAAKDQKGFGGVAIPATGDNLLGVIQALASAVTLKHQEALNQYAQAEAARQQTVAVQASVKTIQDTYAKQVEDVRKETEAKVAEAGTRAKAVEDQVNKIETDRKDERQTYQAAVDAKEKERTDAMAKLAALEKERNALLTKLEQLRPDVKDSVVRVVDARIASLGANNVVYIDRGSADRITPGLTFEVYDKTEGVPPLGKDVMSNDALPQGKASLEVVRVNATSSECRVIPHGKNGAVRPVAEGDLLVNVVYDPNVRYNFVVYGKFDLDQNNRPSAEDAEVIKRLVTQWGGKLMDDVTPQTDFLILGSEPEVPNLSEEERKNPPVEKAYQDALAAREAYDAIRNKAVDYKLPVLNQNRFLYYTGYYDLARR